MKNSPFEGGQGDVDGKENEESKKVKGKSKLYKFSSPVLLEMSSDKEKVTIFESIITTK